MGTKARRGSLPKRDKLIAKAYDKVVARQGAANAAGASVCFEELVLELVAEAVVRLEKRAVRREREAVSDRRAILALADSAAVRQAAAVLAGGQQAERKSVWLDPERFGVELVERTAPEPRNGHGHHPAEGPGWWHPEHGSYPGRDQ